MNFFSVTLAAKSTVLLLSIAIALSGCARGGIKSDRVVHDQDCHTREGVTLISDSEVRLSLGQRPTAGYTLHFRQLREEDGVIRITYREISPPEEQFAAQIMTSPCVRIPLIDDWREVEVINSDNGQIWQFRPQTVSSKAF